ncbi:MAG: class I SAM-dependent methyltransferase [Gemmatimonadaceae bacterium]
MTPRRSAPAPVPAFEPERYASWFDTELGRLVWEDERAALLPLLGPVGGKAVLDGGIGDARLAVELVGAGARVTGVDAALPMLRLARRRSEHAAVALPLAAGDLEALPFRTESFDLVVAVTVLCVAAAPERAIRELARVLVPGGRLVIAELGRWSLWAAQRRLRGFLGHAQWRRTRFWTPASLERLVRVAGLEPVNRAAAVFYPPSAMAGRLLRPLESRLARRTTLGAAFVVVAAEKR